MAVHIRDEETDALVRRLAEERGIGLTEAIRLAVRHELSRSGVAIALEDRLLKIGELLAAYPDTDITLDKEFFDRLSGG